ncbi:hypothetical protein G6F57_006088 [Rhizopus arrhizus]|uniref:Ras-GEF domain-containing protein n=1 Tax=Rhizopus oryzae TaxID=64495 RepID=A0A9P6XAH8_RHIOR|nr:hypothetical protein G6F23_008415 [Rhizopus arrhizus]KAG1410504.1 hypothetical protein G6F58_009093 [Rhizopus delemar]KAG0763775.1 hypothetical protein G6F24_005761 [Rhizopus arrhizus]KAG0790316.1 hypothetical protein G6F21_005890 [Rhizopus arrhizus]KAG0790711.1 hypothetical protein G6F22_006339 [Rhizopus arrhizus]
MVTSDNSGLPVIPLSPIAQSYILYSNAFSQASEKLNEAKQTYPPVSVDVMKRLINNVRIERQQLDAITRKMQSVEAATPLFWDSDTLARQIATVNCGLYNAVMLDKRALSQLDQQQTKLCHLVDFHKYLTHSMAHQLIYWAELTKPNNTTAPAVVPPVHPKDNLVAHLVRVAYLLLHAYRDFSGFAAVIKALTLPEVRRLKKIWQSCSSRTKEMFRDLAQIISPANDYQVYRNFLRNKLELYVHIHHHRGNSDSSGMMIAIPWIQPHFSAIQSIVTYYTAGDNEDQQTLGGDIILSAPGAHKMDIEMSILELCQRNSTISDSLLEDILSNASLDKKKSRRSSIAAVSKAIHLDGLRTAVIPAANLNHLAPGDQLTHHWLVSRVYLRRDQLIDESKEVEPLKPGEQIACDEDELNETARYTIPATPAVSAPISRRTSFVLQIASTATTTAATAITATDKPAVETKLFEVSSAVQKSVNDEDSAPKENTSTTKDSSNEHDDDNDSDHSNDGDAQIVDLVKSNVDGNDQNGVESEAKHEVTPHQEIETNKEIPKETVTMNDSKEKPKANEAKSVSVASKSSTNISKPKSSLSPSAPEFIPNMKSNTKPINNISSVSEGKWSGYPEEDNDSETWKGYPVPKSNSTTEEEDEVWKGYPGPNSSTDSPRRGSSQSETSEEWKGYHATKMEADWQRESAMKVQEYEWQGYTLETYNEDELDSSTMMDGEFEKSRKARGQQGNGDKLLEDFQRNRNTMIK